MPIASVRKTLEAVFGPMVYDITPEEREQFYKNVEHDQSKPAKKRSGYMYFYEKIKNSYCDFEDRIRDRIK